MSQSAVSVHGKAKEASFPFMVFGSGMLHLLLLTLMIAAPQLFPRTKREPFGGPSGAGGLNVIGVVDFNLGKTGAPAKKKLTQEEPAPSLFVKKKTEEDKPLESKTALPDPDAKKKKKGTACCNFLPQRSRFQAEDGRRIRKGGGQEQRRRKIG